MKHFNITNQLSEHSFSCASDQTILAAAKDASVDLAHQCQKGSCGTCKVFITQGSVDYGSYKERALSAEEKSNGMALFCKAKPLEDIVFKPLNSEGKKATPARTLPARVTQTQMLTSNILKIVLSLPDAFNFAWDAGQYIDIVLTDGVKRSFSIAHADSGNKQIELHVKNIPGGRFSAYAFSDLESGSILRVHGPLGIFSWSATPKESILVATSTGISPIAAMLEDRIKTGNDTNVHLYWGGRNLEDLYLHEQFISWDKKYGWFHYAPVLSRSSKENWSGRTGYVQDNVIIDFESLCDYQIYCAGSPQMVDAAMDRFLKAGMLRKNWFCDPFELSYV